MPNNPLSPREEWKRHWTLVLAAAAGFSFTSFMTPAVGLFMGPLQDQFGWSRSLLSAGPAVSASLSLVLAPLFGLAIDRFGSRRLALPGLVATGLVIAGFSTLSGSELQWFLLWIAFGLCVQAIAATIWTAAVAGTFLAGRGLALGVTLSGSAVALAVVPPLAEWLISHFGWRHAFVAFGLGWGGFSLILCLLFFYDARDRQRVHSPSSATDGPPATGLTIREARRSWALWRVAISTVLILTITVGVGVHQVPILVDAGVSRSQAALLSSIGGIAGIVGKLVTGSLLDRFHVRWIGGLTLASTAVAYPLLLDGIRTPMLIAIAIVINGYAAGTKMQLCSYLTARYGGLRHYGAIYGFMAAMIAVAGGLGPILAGGSYDHFGSYEVFLVAGTIISVVSGLLVFSLGQYPRWNELHSDPAPQSDRRDCAGVVA